MLAEDGGVSGGESIDGGEDVGGEGGEDEVEADTCV